MAEQKNNPDVSSDEDWAMSEPEAPEKKESQADREGENVADLYDPLESGDLKGWDLAPPEAGSPEQPSFAPENVRSSPETVEPSSGLDPALESVEILKPVQPPTPSSDDWGMAQPVGPNTDGWKMPEPIFRVSEGRVHKNTQEQAEVEIKLADESLEETLAEIYAPPDSDDAIEAGADDLRLETSGPEPEGELEFNEETNISSADSDKPVPAEKTRFSRSGWFMIGFGIFAFVVVTGLITLAAFGLIYWRSR